MSAPFANCKYRMCDLPGQCRDEGHCHHPASGERGDAHGRLQTENNELVHETERLRERLAEDGPAALWAEIYSLREQLKGPDGFATWKDAAIHERQLRGADARPVPYRTSSDCPYVGATEEIKCAWADGWNQCAQFTKGSHDGY